MTSSGEIPSKVKKITIANNQMMLEIQFDGSHPDPAEAQTSEVPTAHPCTGIGLKKLAGKNRKSIESEDDDDDKDFEAPSISLS